MDLNQPLPQMDNPVFNAMRGLQGASGSLDGVQATGGAPVQAEDFFPTIPTSKKELLMQLAMGAGMAAGPGVAQAAWKRRGIPETIAKGLATEGKGASLLQKLISARDSVFHATSAENAEGMLKDGKIDFYNTDNFDPGVSVSRVPSLLGHRNKPVTVVLDPSKLPESWPYVDSENYAKSKLQLNNEGRFHSYVPNSEYEFENRTKGQPIPMDAAREIWVDRQQSLPSEIEKLRVQAADKGLKFRTFKNADEMARARASHLGR